METILLQRTTTDDPHFGYLITLLDHELWVELKEDQATYDQYNKVPEIKTAVVVYADEKPVACGCFKKNDATTAEIKRMYVNKAYRGRGLSKLVLAELENWARSEGFTAIVLETSIHFATAINLYKKNGYNVIPN
jgi:putative acetyltransferase